MKKTLIGDNRYAGRTLIVDDMEIVYEKLKDKFKYSTYAGTVKEGLEEIASSHYDLIISDYHLGDDAPKGGLEIIRAARDRGLPSILMSRDHHKKEAEGLGVRFIFKKVLLESEDMNKLLG